MALASLQYFVAATNRRLSLDDLMCQLLHIDILKWKNNISSLKDGNKKPDTLVNLTLNFIGRLQE